MDHVRLDIRDHNKRPSNCTACNALLGGEAYTHDFARREESFCSEQCARDHYWEVYASDSYLGII